MNIQKDFDLSQALYYKIGPKVRFYLNAKSVEEIYAAIDFVRTNKIDNVQIIGMGSNVLMNDREFDGAVIQISETSTGGVHATDDGLISCFSGNSLDSLIQFGFENNFTGFEKLGGLPSTVGAAVRGNAGAFGTETKDAVVKVEAVDLGSEDLTQVEFVKEECEFGYRDSVFKHRLNLLIVKGFFQLEYSSPEQVEDSKKIYQEKIQYRKDNHPMEYPSCGSVFKNINNPENVAKIISIWPDLEERVKSNWYGKVSMGYVINRLGFTGKKIGGAQVSTKHSNYISNIDNAKFSDVFGLICNIKESFEKTFGFIPELEVQVVE